MTTNTHRQKTARLGLSAGLLSLALAMGLSAPAQARAVAKSPDVVMPVLAKDAKGQSIVAYFSQPDAELNAAVVAKPTAGGFYRVLLGRDAKGLYRIQDHYQDNGAPQSNVITARDTDLTQWTLEAIEGPLTLYRPSGQVRAKGSYRKGQPHGKDVFYNDDGSERSVVFWSQGSLEGPFRMKEPGTQRRVEGVAKDNEVKRIKAWDAEGQPLSREAAMALFEEALTNWAKDQYR